MFDSACSKHLKSWKKADVKVGVDVGHFCTIKINASAVDGGDVKEQIWGYQIVYELRWSRCCVRARDEDIGGVEQRSLW